MRASEGGHLKIVEKLLKSGADMNLKTNSQQTAVMIAIQNDRLKVVDKLLKSGMNIDQKDNNE